MVANEFCCKPTVTSFTITFTMSMSFLSCHLFNEDEKSPMELLKGGKLNQTLLKFAPLCFPNIHNLIVSLKHRPNNPSSLDYIFELKALSGYDYI